ncbi:hypothetical protein QZH41_009501 [Actinostola sp. cb2023]|nr:hypothetical protein QZH41_009501 [Actinostola sp. cb2023]
MSENDHVAKFERFSANANLKTISEDTYTNLRKKYVFPVVKNTWEQEQSTVFEDLKSRDVGIALAGDGRCDSPGHCAKYCTYTLLDVESQKVVDFKVISVSQVTSANVMEIKGFREALQNVEANGVEPSIISTDRHPQIRKEMRVNHVNKDHQFDPWHLAKSVSKKLGLAAKRKDCESLANWIPSIVNHLWWSAMTCDTDAEVLREKWISTIHHVVNRHDWPGNRHYHKCAHEPLDARQERKKIWLEPGFPTVMTYGTMLASLDHNKNANRQQAVYQDGEFQGEPRYRISWSKVHKGFRARPVLENKSYDYMREMVADVLTLADSQDYPEVVKKDRTHIMAPQERPSRDEIILRRLQACNINSAKLLYY